MEAVGCLATNANAPTFSKYWAPPNAIGTMLINNSATVADFIVFIMAIVRPLITPVPHVTNKGIEKLYESQIAE